MSINDLGLGPDKKYFVHGSRSSEKKSILALSKFKPIRSKKCFGIRVCFGPIEGPSVGPKYIWARNKVFCARRNYFSAEFYFLSHIQNI